MRFPYVLSLVAGCLAAVTASAQQGLVCPPAAGQNCNASHYHVQRYRPDTRAFVEISAQQAFATPEACERVRNQQMLANLKVVEYFRDGKQQQYPPDRFGPCHCDQTGERTSATFLNEAQRESQLRTEEEIRLRVRERLLDHKIPGDSELIRGLYADPPATPALNTPRLMPLPAPVSLPITTSLDELRTTRVVDAGPPAVVGLNLPLVDLTAGATPAAAELEVSAPPGEPTSAAGTESGFEETVVEPQPEIVYDEPAAENPNEIAEPPQETAERFIGYETQRIQNVLRASSAITDESVKSRIFEACMDRIQLLSNLRLLIESSGARSRLATAARNASDEADRLALVTGLFGDRFTAHWAPADAADVVVDIESEIANAPERVLRDSTGRYTTEQKKSAVYLVLAETQLTEEQRLWLATIVEGFLP